jgi:hypothetical protein
MLDDETLRAAKVCTKCGRLLPPRAFSKRAKARDGLQPRCRECAAQWHLEHRESRLPQIRKSTREAKARNYRLLHEYLLEHPCVDCGGTDLLVLEFDHIGGDKTMDVSRLVQNASSWKTIEREIAKCEVVCANCHKRRTIRRAGSTRSRW